MNYNALCWHSPCLFQILSLARHPYIELHIAAIRPVGYGDIVPINGDTREHSQPSLTVYAFFNVHLVLQFGIQEAEPRLVGRAIAKESEVLYDM